MVEDSQNISGAEMPEAEENMIPAEQTPALFGAILTQKSNYLVEDSLNVSGAEMLQAGEKAIQAQRFGMWCSISAGSLASAIHHSISMNNASMHQHQ